jgi:hypothetical protein
VTYDDGAPAAGVAVRAWKDAAFFADPPVDLELTTDADGRFELAGLETGTTCHVHAARPGFCTASVRIAVSDPVPEIPLVLGRGGVVEGVVRGADGRPVAGAAVFLLPQGGEIPAQAPSRLEGRLFGKYEFRDFVYRPVTTDGDGRFAFRGVTLSTESAPRRWCAATRDATGREAWSEPAELTRPGERRTMDLSFARAARMTVRVTGTEPLPGELGVTVTRVAGEYERSASVDAARPTCTFDGVPPGAYSVRLRHRGARGDPSWMRTEYREVPAGVEIETAFDLDGDAMVEGLVVDLDGRPVPGFPLTFETEDWDGAEVWNEAADVTGADGRFRLGPLPRVVGKLIDGERREGGPRYDFAPVRVADVLPGAAPVRIVVAPQPRPRVRGRVVSRPLPRGLLFPPIGAEVAPDGSFEGEVSPPEDRPEIVLRALGRDDLAPVVLEAAALDARATCDLGDVRFDSGLTVEGALRTPGGEPLHPYAVSHDDGWAARPAVVDVDEAGRFRIDHVPAREVHLTVIPAGAAPRWQVTLDPRASPVSIVVGPGTPLRIRVVGGDGTPARDVAVKLEPADGTGAAATARRFVRTGADGSVVVNVQPRRWRASVRPVGSLPLSAEVVVAETGKPSVELRLP